MVSVFVLFVVFDIFRADEENPGKRTHPRHLLRVLILEAACRVRLRTDSMHGWVRVVR